MAPRTSSPRHRSPGDGLPKRGTIPMMDPVTTWHLNRYCVGMTSAIARHIPRPLSVLTALAALTLSAPLALVGAPGHAAPAAGEIKASMDIDIVVNSDQTYTAKFVMTTSTETPLQEICTDDAFKTPGAKSVKNMKANYKEEGDTATCTAEGTEKVSDSKGQVTHKNGEYTVKTPDFGTDSADANISVSQSVTFPGKVTEADGGKVEGNKVSFTDGSTHTVKGKDGSIPMWVWLLVGVGVLALIGGLAAFLIIRSKKNKTQVPYGAPVQGYDPNQAFPAQPGQQAGYGTPQAQPGYGAPGQQAGYGTPQAQQPGQQTDDGTPGQGIY